jgi:hypothetical protein
MEEALWETPLLRQFAGIGPKESLSKLACSGIDVVILFGKRRCA